MSLDQEENNNEHLERVDFSPIDQIFPMDKVILKGKEILVASREKTNHFFGRVDLWKIESKDFVCSALQLQKEIVISRSSLRRGLEK